MRCSSCSDELPEDGEAVLGIGGHPACASCAAQEACAAAVMKVPPTEAPSLDAVQTVWVVTVEIDADAVFDVHVFSTFAVAKQAAVELALSAVGEEDEVDSADVDACIEAAQAHGAVVTLHERVVQTAFAPVQEGER